MSDAEVPPPPKVGDDIYVPSALHLSHGRDDFEGGRVRVTAVGADQIDGRPRYWIEIAEEPGTRYNWSWLGPQQSALRARYGDNRGHLDPDLRPEFNRDD